MRLSDSGLRQRQSEALYPNHRFPPCLNEDETRDRSNRLLDDVGSLFTPNFKIQPTENAFASRRTQRLPSGSPTAIPQIAKRERPIAEHCHGSVETSCWLHCAIPKMYQNPIIRVGPTTRIVIPIAAQKNAKRFPRDQSRAIRHMSSN
jgi:hypothetical protein